MLNTGTAQGAKRGSFTMENAARSRPDARRQAREKGAKAARQKAKAFKLRFVNEDGSVHEVASKMSVPPGSRRPRASSGQRARNLEGPKAPPPPLPQQQQQQQSPPVRQTQALSMKDKVEDRITEAFKDLVATTPPTARELELELMDKWTKPAAKETKSSATKLGANRTKKSLAQEDEDEDEDESWPPIKTTRAKNFAARKSPSGLRSSMPSASRMFQNVGCGILERMSRARCGPCGIKQITYFGLMSVGVLTVFYFIKLGALMSPPFALEGTQAHEESPVVPHVKTPPAFSQEPASTFSKEAASAHLNKPRIPQTSWPVIHGEPETSKVADEYEGTGNAPLTKKQKESEPLPSKYEQNRVFPPRDDQNEDETSAFPFVEEPKPTSSSTQYNGADESNVVGSTPRVHVGQDASTFAASTFGANDVASQPHVHGTHQTTTSENRDSGASFERTDKPSRPRVHDGPHDDTIDDAAALGTPRVFDPVPASEPDSSPHPVTRDADAEKSLVAGFTAGASTPSEEIDEALAQFLQLARLSQYASALLDIGVETMEDLELLVRKDIDELKSVGMKRVQLLRLEQMLLHRPSTDPLRTSTSENEEDVDEILDARAPSLPKVDFADDQSVETYPSGKVDENSLAERKAPKSGSDHSVEYGARASNLGSKKEPKSSTLVESPKGKIAPTVSTQGDHAAESQDATSSVATNVHSQPKVDGQASENSGGDAADSFAAQDKVPSQEPAKDEVTSPISTRGNDAAESPDSASSVATNVGLRPYVEDQQNKDSEDSATDSKTKSEISRSSDLKSEHLASRPKVDFGNEEASDFDTATKTDDIGTNKNPSETEGSSPPTIFPEATGKKAPRVESIVEETSSEEKVPTPSQANVPAQPTAGTSSSKLAQEASEAIAIAPHGGPTAHDSATSMPPEDAESQDVFAPSTHDMESRKDSGFKNESPRASARPIVDASEPGSPLEPASSLKPASHASDADSRQGRRLRG